MKISLVVPVYNEQVELAEVLAKYILDLKSICESDPTAGYEVIAVNDGSTDQSQKILANAARLNRALRVINFDTRYGKQAAVTAGMDAATGDCVVLADVDILNPVGILKRVVAEFSAGEQIVYAYRERNGFDRFENACSEFFVGMAAGVFGVGGRYTGRPRIALYSRDVADVIRELPAKNKQMRTMDSWVDYKIKRLNYASGYNRAEEREKTREAKAQFRRRGGDTVQRSKVREYTTAQIYARTFLAMTLILFVTAVVLLAAARLAFLYHFFLWIVMLSVLIITVMLYARAALIRRVGLVRNHALVEGYSVKSTIN
jgi:dolichol-phosphate mannosyltransferase